MPRLSDLPEPYAVVVILPNGGHPSATTTITVNGRIAKLIAWMLDHRPQIEGMRTGHVLFDFGPTSYQAEVKERFAHEGVTPSADAMRGGGGESGLE
jgi:hypothetical protein